MAASLAANSRHPLARALVAAAPAGRAGEGVTEHPGPGLMRMHSPGAAEIRLGSRAFCGNPGERHRPPVAGTVADASRACRRCASRFDEAAARRCGGDDRGAAARHWGCESGCCPVTAPRRWRASPRALGIDRLAGANARRCEKVAPIEALRARTAATC